MLEGCSAPGSRSVRRHHGRSHPLRPMVSWIWLPAVSEIFWPATRPRAARHPLATTPPTRWTLGRGVEEFAMESVWVGIDPSPTETRVLALAGEARLRRAPRTSK